jgi:formamidopyrimidine-DNA glycosylase
MPELPEVESVVRALRPIVLSQTIRRCIVRHGIAVRPQSARVLRAKTKGRRIEGVERYGKYVVLRLTEGCLVIHFRLDGQLLWFPERRLDGHIDVALELDGGTLGFVDRRHFGRVLFFQSPQACPGIASLGVDPLSQEFTSPFFRSLLRRSARPLKLLLLDQSRIAGLGNIYSSEALWQARLDPRRRASHVPPAGARRLHKAIVSILRAAIECCSNPRPDFRDPDWWFQGLERILGVYDREDKPCRRCASRVRRIEQGGRSTYFCPRCQK